MARRVEKYEIFAKQLVAALTEFTDEEENFDLCMDYVASNFKYHKFLDPDSHKLKRTFEGLLDKFRIHCQDEKAKLLESKVQQFLEIPAFELRDHGNTETHWAVLSLLFCLSDSPVNAVYKERKKKKKKEAEDDFDWTAYLLEGEDLYREPNYESPELSDDDEDEVVKYTKATKDIKTKTHEGQEKPIQLQVQSKPAVDEEVETAEDWLRRNVIVQYWKGEKIAPCTSHLSSNLTNVWESHLTATSEIYVPEDKTTVSEYQIVRETIWMLSGATDSFVYEVSDDQCHVSNMIKVSHLTEGSLHNVLESIAEYVTKVLKLHKFVDSVTNVDIFASTGSSEDGFSTLTYQAFAYCVNKYLTGFKKTLVHLEKHVKEQVGPITLSSLLKDVSPFFEEIDLFYLILNDGIKNCSTTVALPERTSHLLAVIYDTLLTCDTMGEHGTSKVSLLLRLWVETCKPYLDIIDNWICNGVLLDPKKEFIIQRNEEVQCLDETFWDTAFTLHCSDKPRKHAAYDTDSEVEEEFQTYAPNFLLPVLQYIVLAGKSMEMLESLGKKAEFVEHQDMFSKRTTLYENFIQSMEGFLGTVDLDDTNTRDNTRLDKDETDSSSEPNFFDDHSELRDPLLRDNFTKIFSDRLTKSETFNEKHEALLKKLECLQLNGMTPVQLILERCLYPHIKERYDIVCLGLLRIMKEEFRLMDYLASMRRFYLMEAGDTMYDFYIEVFDKLRHREPWQDISYLTMLLQEALQIHYPQEIDRLSVQIDSAETKPKTKQPITALEGLYLQYRVPWPVDVVLSTRAMGVYNQVFAFLLQIKRAKFCLDELRFTDLEKPDILAKDGKDESFLDLTQAASSEGNRKQLVHQMQILRMQLLTFVNSLHNYIMTRILHTTGLEFQANIEKACDLDQLIYVHKKYLATIHERCLQHKGVLIIRDIVIKVLSLALQFQKMWDDGVDHLSIRSINEMELEFSRCMKFLSSVLNNAIKRGSFQHLESLAFALITFEEQKKP